MGSSPIDIAYTNSRSDSFVVPGLSYDTLVCGTSLAFAVRHAAITAMEQVDLICKGIQNPVQERNDRVRTIVSRFIDPQNMEDWYASVCGT